MPRSITRRDFLRAGAAATLVGGVGLPATAAVDPGRVALVVGNDAYPGAPLANAVNDARAVGALLGQAGFAVTLKTDVDREALRAAAASFAEAARGSAARQVFFYYAGHGAQMDWRNYLLPVDARVNAAADLPAQCLDLGALLVDLAKAKGKTFVLILDACRDNPFGAAFRPPQKGLSQFDAPPGSLLAFSTAPGSVAADGSGANGLYTEHLVRELSVKGVKLEDALKRVRLAVRLASRGAQVPWESTSLESDVYVFPAAAGKLSEAELEAQFAREFAEWNRIKASKRVDDWVGYLREYPSGRFNEIAQNRLNLLLRVAEEQAARPSPTPAVTVAAAPVMVPAPSASTPVAPLPPTAPVAAVASVVAAAASAVPVPPTSTSAGALAAGGASDGARPQLVVGPGLPVPVLMRPSPNPASAGTYVNYRVFSVGDEFVYAVSDPVNGGKVERQAERITRVDEEADRIEINGGETVLDTMGNLLHWQRRTYDPRAQTMPAELQLGHKWTARYRMAFDGRVFDAYFDFRVAAREVVRVPAGEFDSFRLEGDGFNTTTGARISVMGWVVPGLVRPLRSQRIFQARGSVYQEAELRELVSCRQMRWSPA